MIRFHNLRAIRSGRFHHVEAHIVVPEFWLVEQAHDLSEAVAADVIKELSIEGQISFHADPCRRAWCASCDLPDCAVRRVPFTAKAPLTLDEVVRPEPGPVD